MPGDNCSVYNCGRCRREHGVGIFQVLGKPTEKHLKKAETSPTVVKNLASKAKWRAEFLNAVSKTRVADAAFQQLVEKDRVFACERHFLPSEIISHKGAKMTKHTLVRGAIPRYNMRGLSEIDERVTAEASMRPYRSIVQEQEQPPEIPHVYYEHFEDFCKRIKTLKSLQNWTTDEIEGGLVFTFPSEDLTIPLYTISVDKNLNFALHVFDFALPTDHQIYKQYTRSMKNITLSNLIILVQGKKICDGLKTHTLGTGIILHSIPYKIVPFLANNTQTFRSKTYCRSKHCTVLIDGDDGICTKCSKLDAHVRNRKTEHAKRMAQPCKLKAPISATSAERVKLTMQNVQNV